MGTRTNTDGQATQRCDASEPLIKKHGGYRKLKSFKLAQLIHDLTALFVPQFVDPKSRTRDQMVQAARSGTQNIGEGSSFSATTSKLEISITNAARASQEELRLDYEDFLRQRGFPKWGARHPALMRFKSLRCSTVAEVLEWAASEEARAAARADHTRTPGWAKTSGSGSPCRSVLLANAALSLLNIASYLLDRQIQSLAESFAEEGGFSERMHRVRAQRRMAK